MKRETRQPDRLEGRIARQPVFVKTAHYLGWQKFGRSDADGGGGLVFRSSSTISRPRTQGDGRKEQRKSILTGTPQNTISSRALLAVSLSICISKVGPRPADCDAYLKREGDFVFRLLGQKNNCSSFSAL